MSRKSWHAIKLGSRTLAPETLMMGYGYDPHLSERFLSLKRRRFSSADRDCTAPARRNCSHELRGYDARSAPAENQIPVGYG